MLKMLTNTPQRRSQMENIVETALESRKEWAKPELKKIDIEQITAAGFYRSSDASSRS
jgi:hypothetical protein